METPADEVDRACHKVLPSSAPSRLCVLALKNPHLRHLQRLVERPDLLRRAAHGGRAPFHLRVARRVLQLDAGVVIHRAPRQRRQPRSGSVRWASRTRLP
jgi:hypothetical protein